MPLVVPIVDEISQTDIQVGQFIHRIVCQVITPLPEVHAVAYQFKHEQSGARILHLYSRDIENLFAIFFPLAVTDSSGVSHVLEHAVMAGSKSYPDKGAFYQKNMATYLNGVIGPDSACYMAASTIKQDLFNLADVLIDSAFHPLLSQETFDREGYHFEANVIHEQPVIRGVVYNEMKGIYSNPEARLQRRIGRGLLPDTNYYHDSGGHPDEIVNLTYDQLRKFHESHYHPSNACFFLYGNIPSIKFLQFLEKQLRTFKARKFVVSIPTQPSWTTPRTVRETYPVADTTSLEERTYLTMHWLIGDATRPKTYLAWRLVSLILAGHEAAPLKQALMETPFPSHYMMAGVREIGRELIFSVGVKGSQVQYADDFVHFVIDVLANLAAQPIPAASIEAAFQQITYETLEISSMFPLQLLGGVMKRWLYGRDPLAYLQIGRLLADCQKRSAKDPLFFNALIRDKLLNNRHRLDYILAPTHETAVSSPLVTQPQQAQSYAPITPTPQPIPHLKISDLPKQLPQLNTTVQTIEKIEILRHHIPTNNINYFILNINLEQLPPSLWPYLPYYAETIKGMATTQLNHAQVAQQIAQATGGIQTQFLLETKANRDQTPIYHLQICFKTLDAQTQAALFLLGQLLFAPDYQAAYLQKLCAKLYTQHQTQRLHDGIETATYHAARHLSHQDSIAERIHGLSFLRWSQQISANFDTVYQQLIAKLQKIQRFLLIPQRFTISVTGSDRAYHHLRQALERWLPQMTTSPENSPKQKPFSQHLPQWEGVVGPLQIAHCVQLLPAPHYTHPLSPSLAVGAKLISSDYLSPQIRDKGTAYGAWCDYDALKSRWRFISYRDPHIIQTLNVFADTCHYVDKASWDGADMERAVMAAVKQEMRPIRPERTTAVGLRHHLTALSPQRREAYYEAIKSVQPKEVKHAVLTLLESQAQQSAICIFSNKKMLETANQEKPGLTLEGLE